MSILLGVFAFLLIVCTLAGWYLGAAWMGVAFVALIAVVVALGLRNSAQGES